MNLTAEQYLTGLERTVNVLPLTLAEWNEIDDDLRESYADDMEWMVSVLGEVIAHERIMGHDENVLRLLAAAKELEGMRDSLERIMGVDVPRDYRP